MKYNWSTIEVQLEYKTLKKNLENLKPSTKEKKSKKKTEAKREIKSKCCVIPSITFHTKQQHKTLLLVLLNVALLSTFSTPSSAIPKRGASAKTPQFPHIGKVGTGNNAVNAYPPNYRQIRNSEKKCTLVGSCVAELDRRRRRDILLIYHPTQGISVVSFQPSQATAHER